MTGDKSSKSGTVLDVPGQLTVAGMLSQVAVMELNNFSIDVLESSPKQ